MEIAAERRLFETSCQREWRELAKTHELVLIATGAGQLDGTVVDIKCVWRNATTIVKAYTESWGCRIAIDLFRNEHLPKVFGATWDADCSLDELIGLRNPDLNYNVRLLLPSKLVRVRGSLRDERWKRAARQFTANAFRETFQRAATALHRCADDILRGDFSILEELAAQRSKQQD